MTTTRGTAFAAAMRVIDRVHNDATNVRATTEPTIAACFAQINVAMIRVGHGANRCHAFLRHIAHLARRQTQQRQASITTDKLSVGAGRTSNLTALANLELHIVDNRADRNAAKRQSVAWLDIRIEPGPDGIALGLLGSYSIRSTKASISSLARLKSTTR
jgi:hypothetical protein